MSKFFAGALITILSTYGYLGLVVNTYKYDIRLYGVIYDSTQDNTPGIQRAEDSCNSQLGGSVFVPAYCWGITKLVMSHKVGLVGESKTGTRFSARTADTMITYDDNQFNTWPVTGGGNAPGYGTNSLKNLTLEGHNTALIGINDQYGYWFDHENLVIDSMSVTGLNLKGTLTGVYDDLLIKWCPIGVTADTVNKTPGGAVAVNLLTFRNLKVYNCPNWGFQIANTNGAIKFDQCDFSDEGTTHNPNTGCVRATKPAAVGATLLFENCWFEHNVGTLVKTDLEASPVYVTMINCEISNTLTPSYGVYVTAGNGAAAGSYLNLIGTNIQADSVDLHVSGFNQINLIGSNYGTADITSTSAYVYIHNLSTYGVAFPAGLSGPAFVSSSGTGAGTSPTTTVSSQSTSYTGDITVVTGTSPAASAVVCTIGWSNAWAATGISPGLTPGNAAAAALSGTALVWPTDAGSTTHYLQLNVGSTALAASTTYIWHYTIGGK
jgi:hypothetical protein